MPEIRVATLGETTPDIDNDDKRNTDEQQKAVKKCSDWFEVDKEAKQFYVEEMDESDKLRANKHWDLLGPTGQPLRTPAQQAVHPNSTENVTHALVEGQVAEFAQDIEFQDFPREEGDDGVALIMTDVKQYLTDKNRLQMERLDYLRNFFWHGTAVWKHVWDPTWRGGRGPHRWIGEVRIQSRHPRLVFPDGACGKDIHNGRRIHDARYVTLEYIKEKFPEYGSLAQGGVLDTTLLSATDDETTVDAQLERTLLIETWYIGEPLIKDKPADGEVERTGSGLNVIWWCGETNGTYLGHANYLYFDEDEDPRFPFTFRARYPRDNSPWGYGDAYFIKQVQIMLNKTSDIIMEGHIHQVLGQTLYTKQSLNEKQQRHIQQTGTLGGMWHEVQELDGIRRLYGAGIPASVQNETTRLRGVMENITGRYDVTLGRTPGSVTAFKALALLDQRAQVRLRSADVAITTSYEDMGNYINQILPKHYSEQRAYRIIGSDGNGNQVIKKRGVFKLEDVQKVHFFKDGRVMPRSAVNPETDLADMTEGEDYEVYVPEMDVRCKTTATLPSERLFYMEMAKELLAARMIPLEVFYYVVENGRFPPWMKVAEMMASEEQAQAQAPAQGGPGTMPPGGRLTYTWQSKDPSVVSALMSPLQGQQQQESAVPPDLQALLGSLSEEEIGALSQLPPEQLQAVLSLPPEEIVAVLQQGQAPQPAPGPRQWTAQGGMVDVGPQRGMG